MQASVSSSKHAPFAPHRSPRGRRAIARAQTSTALQPVHSIQQVVQQQGSKYKAVLVDQFGVLHDGQQASKEAIAACRALHERGVQLYVLSNSSRRASGTIERLEKLGYDPAWFAGAVTSGELTFQHLLNRPTEWWRTLGRRVLHLTWKARGAISLEGLNLSVVDHPEEADFILAHGTEAVSAQWDRPVRELTLAQMNQFLERCAYASRVHKPLPMVVANPDLVTVNGKELVVMPGTLAKTYGELGGPVRIMGKPDRIIFDAALQTLGLSPDQVLVVGDSLHHDIAGAAAAGMDSLLVAGGIHASELLPAPSAPSTQQQQQVDQAALRRLCEEHGATPTFVTNSLTW